MASPCLRKLPQSELQIRQVANDSRKVRPAALFVAIHGVATDGNLFAKDAVTRGAAAIMSEDAGAAGLAK